jgi:hypothetical protein
MKIKAIAVNIAEPCNQNWDLMEHRDTERFCESCQKCVVDFSGYSNSEIIKELNSSKSDICGRLTNRQLAQLNYYLISVPTNKNWMKYLGVLAIGASMFIGEARAANLKEPVEIIHSPSKFTNTPKTASLKKIYGYVFDENKKPVSGIRVVILNTKLAAKTDDNGRYEITLDKNEISKNNLIKIESLKFEGSIKINFSVAKQADIHLQEVYMMMGKIAMTSKN